MPQDPFPGPGPDSEEPGSSPPPADEDGEGLATGPSLAALVTITVPWSTYTGRSETPGQADGYGPWTATTPAT
jgi:hypothetical protein